jgi:hypothetical protein
MGGCLLDFCSPSHRPPLLISTLIVQSLYGVASGITFIYLVKPFRPYETLSFLYKQGVGKAHTWVKEVRGA